MKPSKNRQQIVVFDVNETLLDIEALSPFFKRTFGHEGVMRQWFAELILYSQALTLSGNYAPFGQLGVAVLNMVANIHRVALKDDDIAEFSRQMAALPAHADAAPALEKLRSAGFRLMTLTNSSPVAGSDALEKAALADYFEQRFSVDEVKRFKPAAEVYQSVASALEAEPGELMLVAAHVWDTLGASAQGWSTALVTRPGNATLPLGEQPGIVESDLLAVAARMIGRQNR